MELLNAQIVESWRIKGGERDGAHWSFEYTTTKSGIGKTTVNWQLYTRGRYTSPTWLSTGCILKLTYNGKTYEVYNEDYTTGSDCSFNDKFRASGSFEVTHLNNGSGSFTVDFNVRIYELYNYHKTSSTEELPVNYPYTKCTAPTSINLSSNIISKDGRALLSWSGAKAGTGVSISGYNIYQKSGSAPTASNYSKKTYHTGASLYVYPNQTAGSKEYFAIETVSNISGYNSSLSSSVVLTTNTPPSISKGSSNYIEGEYRVTLTITESNGQTTNLYYSIDGGPATVYSQTGTTINFKYKINKNTTFAFWANDGLDNSNIIYDTCNVPLNFNQPSAVTSGYEGYISVSDAIITDTNFSKKPIFTQPSATGGSGNYTFKWLVKYGTPQQEIDITNKITNYNNLKQYDASELPIGTQYEVFCKVIDNSNNEEIQQSIKTFRIPSDPILSIMDIEYSDSNKVGDSFQVKFKNLVKINQLVNQKIYFKINSSQQSSYLVTKGITDSGFIKYDASGIASGTDCIFSYYVVDAEGNQSQNYSIDLGAKASPLIFIQGGNYNISYSQTSLKPISQADSSNTMTLSFPAPYRDIDATLTFQLIYRLSDSLYVCDINNPETIEASGITQNITINAITFITSIQEIDDLNGTRIDQSPLFYIKVNDNYGNTAQQQLNPSFKIDWREFPVFSESSVLSIKFIYEGGGTDEQDTNNKIYSKDRIKLEYPQATDSNNNTISYRGVCIFGDSEQEYNLISAENSNEFYLPDTLNQSEGKIKFRIYAEDGTALQGERYNNITSNEYIKVKQYIPQINIINYSLDDTNLTLEYSYTNIDSLNEDYRGLQRFKNSTGNIIVHLIPTDLNSSMEQQIYKYTFPMQNNKFINSSESAIQIVNLPEIPQQSFFVQIEFKFYYSYPGLETDELFFSTSSGRKYIYLTVPTVAYRKNGVGLNTKVVEESAVLDIYPSSSNNLIVIHQEEDKGKIVINLKDGTVTGLTIDCGKW